MSTIPQFVNLLLGHASNARYYKSSGNSTPCPCRTPEGFRDPEWHLEAPPGTEVCNEAGMLPATPVDVIVKAFMQPIQSTRATRLSTEYIQEVFGNVEADDHLGIFPTEWSGVRLEFHDWSQAGDDFVEYNGERFFVINANMIPDPGDGNPNHHWECGLRLIRSDGLE